MEQLMQKTAEQENPELEPQAREMGIASNPIPERNYAGGGIVAFADAGPVEDKNLPERLPGETDNAYMQRVRAVQEAGSQFFNSRNYNPLAKVSDLYSMYQQNIGQPFAESMKRFANESPESQAARFNAAKQQPTQAAAPTASSNVAANTNVQAPAAPPSAAPTGNRPTGIKSLTNKPNAEDNEPKTPSELQALMAESKASISGNAEEAKQAKKDAMWNRLLEAGLNVMGGQSTNFAQNLALAGPAAKGYGEDVKGLRAEETEKRKQLAALGLRGYELGQGTKKAAAEEQYMAQHGKYFEQAGQAAIANAGRMGMGADKVDIAALQVGLKNTNEALASAKKADKPALIAQRDAYIARINQLAGVGSAPPAASASGAFNYVLGKGLVPVQ
jgi:hypothetical protein